MGKYDDLFDAGPSPSPAETGKYSDLFDEPAVAVTQPEGGGFQFLPRSGAQMDVEEARQGAELAQPIIENPQVGGVFTGLSRAIPRSLSDLIRMGMLPREGDVDEQNQQSEEWGKAVRGEYGPVEQAATLTQTAMAAAPLLHIPIAEDVPPPLRTEPLAPEPPPTQSMGPGTTAADVSNALDWTPQSAPVTPLEETIAKVQPPGPQVSPETGFTHYPGLEDHAPMPSDWAYPVPPPGTPLQGVPLVLNGETPAANLVQSQPAPPNAPLPNGQPPVSIPPGDERYAGVTPQGTGISQAATEAELGPGSVEPGIGAELGSGLEHGRGYINKGGDPRLPIRRANTSGMVGAKDVGIVHAELERLRGERNAAAAALEANPNDPVLQQNHANADNAQRAWRKELQPVLTKASDSLREAQAMSMPNADPATYQGLADLMDEHFKGQRELSDEDRTALTKAARGVKGVRDIANGEMKKVEGELTKKMGGKKVMTPAELDADLRKELETAFSDCVLGK